MTSFTCLTSVAVRPGGGFQIDFARIPCNFTCYEVNRLTDVIGMQYRAHLRVGIFFWKGIFFFVAAFLQHMVRHTSYLGNNENKYINTTGIHKHENN